MASHLPVTEGLDPFQLDVPNDNDKSVNDTIQELHKVQLSHQWDPNLPQEKIDAINEAVKTGDQEKAAELEKTLAQESQYESVRAAVRNTDGGEVANTVRAWVLGMFFTTLGSGLNMFLSMRWALIPMQPLSRKLFCSYCIRSPAISFPAIVVQLLVYPMGCLWAKTMPTRKFNTFGVEWTLNTGPFTIKEHAVITVSS